MGGIPGAMDVLHVQGSDGAWCHLPATLQLLNLSFDEFSPSLSSSAARTQGTLPRSALAFSFHHFKDAGNVPKSWSEQTL